MRVIRLESDCPQDLAQGLKDLESQFQYPLGPGKWFSVSHGQDYPRFFRSMGAGICFVAVDGDRPTGVISGAIRNIQLPDGKLSRIVYIGDLKIKEGASRGWTLLHLARELEFWGRSHADSAYGVVMSGTRALPNSYSGRLGIPGFQPVRNLWVLRVSGATRLGHSNPIIHRTTPDSVSAFFASKCLGRFCPLGGSPELRSRMSPVGLQDARGEACGILEDTLRAKKLVANNGEEILSAHLSSFFCANPASGVELIQEGLGMAQSGGIPALFTSCPEQMGPVLVQTLEGKGLEVVVAPATVFALGPLHEKHPEADWMIHTSEI